MFHPNAFFSPPRWFETPRALIQNCIDALHSWQITHISFQPAQYNALPPEAQPALLHAQSTQKRTRADLTLLDDPAVQLESDVNTLKHELQLMQAELTQSKKLLFQANAERQKFNSALALARDLQDNLQPAGAPKVSGLDVCVRSKPAHEVTGDFYDFRFHGPNELVFTLGDISGKGMAAGLLMTMARKVLRTSLNVLARPTPDAMLDYANRDLYEEFTSTNTFATTFVGQFASERRMLQYANAGHSPVIFRRNAERAQLLLADSAPIGVLPENQSVVRQIYLLPGDTLVVGSDGITDARNEDGEMFGLGRLLQLVDAHVNQSASEIVDAIFQALAAFEAEGAQDDDQTLMVLKGV